MIYLLNSTDPRGESIVLSQARYESHIRHRHETATVAAIQQTVESPDMITRDVDFPTRDNYYVQGADGLFPKGYLKVCVQFDSEVGRVITAITVDRPKPTEEVLWRR